MTIPSPVAGSSPERNGLDGAAFRKSSETKRSDSGENGRMVATERDFLGDLALFSGLKSSPPP